MNLITLKINCIKWIKSVFTCLLFLLIIILPASGSTPLENKIISDLTLTSENSPYIIDSPVIVETGVTLNVSSGVVIKSKRPGIYIKGTLNANGAVFTSIKNDDAGGDTNGDEAATQASGGDWDGLLFYAGSQGNIDSCEISYGSYFAVSGIAYSGQLVIFSDNVIVQNSSIKNGSKSGIYIKKAGPDVLNNTITDHKYISQEYSGGYGIHIINSAPLISENTIKDNNEAGIYLYNSPEASIINNHVSANGTGGNIYAKGIYVYGDSVDASIENNTDTAMVYIDGGILSIEKTWDSTHPWIIGKNFTIGVNGNLNIGANTIIKALEPAGIYVQGTLNASQAVFTSIKDDTAGGDTNNDEDATQAISGDWSGILFESGSSGILDRCSLRYGRYFDQYYGQLVILSNDVTIKNSMIEHGSESGIIIKNSSPQILNNKVQHHLYRNSFYSGGHGISLINSGANLTGNEVQDNNDAGIHLMGSSDAVLMENKVYDNGKGSDSDSFYYKGIYLSDDSVNAEVSGNKDTEMVYLSNGGFLTTEKTWDACHPWIIGRLTIAKTGKLTISPGTIIKSRESWIYVEGKLTAVDTVFTSIEDDSAGGDTNGDGIKTAPKPGQWRGIAFKSGSQGFLDKCEIRYGDSFNFDAQYYSAQLVVLSDNVTISRCTISHGSRSGIYISNAIPTINDNIITNHEYIYPDILGGHGIYMTNCASSISGNKIWQNGDAGIYLNKSPNANITGNQVYDNGTDNNDISSQYRGIYVGAESLNAAISTNSGSDMVYLSTGTITKPQIWDSSQIWAGQGTITIDSAASLEINNAIIKGLSLIVQGQLNALGAVFTSIKHDIGRDTNQDGNASQPEHGDWGAITFLPESYGILNGVTVSYGNEAFALNNTYPGQVVVLSNNVEIHNSIIQNGAASGIYVENAKPVFINNQLLGNNYGIYTKNTSFAVNNHIFIGNNEYGIYNDSSDYQIDGTNNFWGDPSGPQHESNSLGIGDRVSDYVLFDSWIQSPSDNYDLQYVIKALQIVSGIYVSGYIIDITEDGKIGIEDAVLILKKIAGN